MTPVSGRLIRPIAVRVLRDPTTTNLSPHAFFYTPLRLENGSRSEKNPRHVRPRRHWPPTPYSRLLHRGVVLLGRVETGHSGDLHLAVDHVQRRVHVQRDRVDGPVARVDDVHADFALEHAVARVGVQVQPVTAGHDRTGRKRGQKAHGHCESTTRGHGAGCSVGGGCVGRLRPRVGQHGPNG